MAAPTLQRMAIVALVIAAGCSTHKTPGGGPGLVWLAPTTNADGTPLVDLAGFKVHYDTAGRGSDAHHVYANVVDIGMASCTALDGGGTECQADLPSLAGPAGTAYFLAVTAYDRAAPPNESAYSNEVSITR